jgi:hypothetical protein
MFIYIHILSYKLIPYVEFTILIIFSHQILVEYYLLVNILTCEFFMSARIQKPTTNLVVNV